MCNYKKLKFERVAESGDELYDVFQQCRVLANTLGLCFTYFLNLVLLYLNFFIKSAYQSTVVGVTVVVCVSHFYKTMK